MDFLNEISKYLIAHRLVGSRVTCIPPPSDTDQDVLLLVKSECWDELIETLIVNGMDHDGSDVNDPEISDGVDYFQSYSLGDINLILTKSIGFYQKFMAATHVAKSLNLLNKSDRIMLFQAVLYANYPESSFGVLTGFIFPAMPPEVI